MKLRLARRSWEAHQIKELPRSIRRLQSPPFVHAARSRGAPTQFQFGCRQSSTHSDTLPDMSGNPQALPANDATSAVRSSSRQLPQPSQFARLRPISGPQLYAVVVPARAAYSHSASRTGRRRATGVTRRGMARAKILADPPQKREHHARRNTTRADPIPRGARRTAAVPGSQVRPVCRAR